MRAWVTTVAPMTALLLAEPEATMRGFLERQLRSDGFDVLAFRSTDELPRAAEPDVLVLGDPDALERCRVPDCPVIVLGRADPDAKVRALKRCDDYLTRPFVYEELVSRASARCCAAARRGASCSISATSLSTVAHGGCWRAAARSTSPRRSTRCS